MNFKFLPHLQGWRSCSGCSQIYGSSPGSSEALDALVVSELSILLRALLLDSQSLFSYN